LVPARGQRSQGAGRLLGSLRKRGSRAAARLRKQEQELQKQEADLAKREGDLRRRRQGAEALKKQVALFTGVRVC
jgi:uncharacterized protein involved in exopolysaccharide biosynthesis